ncbi:MAG: tetratricopeptide repeat protein [Alphaproteobacteria bacterium]
MAGLARLCAAALFAITVASGPVLADQNDKRLGALFEVLLNAAPGSPEAMVAQQQIWSLWLQAPTATGRILMAQGVDQMQTQDLTGAIKTFTALIELEPDFAEAWNKRATVYFLMGLYPESLADIDETLNLEPRHFGAQSGQGLVFDAMKEPEAALQSFEKALSLNPHMPQIESRAEQLRAELRARQL